MSKKILVVGAGLSGVVVARQLAGNPGCQVSVIDARPHIAGNCHTARDPATGIMIHEYGPHIFNTSDEDVWEYVNRFARFRPYISRIKAVTPRGVYGLPINLMTINQLFGKSMGPAEAKDFIAGLGDKSITEPRNFEEQALKMVGREIYENFFYGYTKKQWGCEPSELPASVFKRLPIRFNYDDNYYSSRYQGIPEEGYSEMVRRILDIPGVDLRLNTPMEKSQFSAYDHVFYSGPIDAFFDFRLGRLRYRTVSFERIDGEGDYQGTALINYTGLEAPFTRIHEHKHFTPWEEHEKTVAFREFSKETGPADEPYYPLRLAEDSSLLEEYKVLAQGEAKTSFIGRLGTYRYLDMDQVIGEALDVALLAQKALSSGNPIPTFGPQRLKGGKS